MCKKLLALVVVYLFVVSVPAFAEVDYVKTIDRLGVQGSQAYFSVKEGFSLNCLYGNIYFSITSAEGRTAYAQVLSAKLSGKKLSRIDYGQDATTTQCRLWLVEIQE